MKHDELTEEEKGRLIEDLLMRREGLNMISPPEYQRLTSKINYLRDREGQLERSSRSRKKHASRHSYERALLPRVKKVLTFEERLRANRAQRKHQENNPQRKLRQGIERCLHNRYSYFKSFGKDTRRGMRGPKAGKSLWLWGCSWDEMHDHISSQLERYGWTWADWKTKWTMDHVVPVRKFVLPQDQYSCWHYTNLRPWPKEKNSRRGIFKLRIGSCEFIW